MRTNSLFSLFFWLLCSQLCSAGDTLKFGQQIINKSGNLVSAGNEFELGFFSLPMGSDSKQYFGIWYHSFEPQTVVWVANRDVPIDESSNIVFQIAVDGNIEVADESGSFWSSSLERSLNKNNTVKLLDSGNLVLIDGNSGANSYLWESFQHPTDTFLPGMKMDDNLTLTSWRNNNDPASGSFTFKKDQNEDSRSYIVKNQSQLYWAFYGVNSEKLSSVIVQLLVNNTASYASSHKFLNQTINLTSPAYDYKQSRLLMNSNGKIQFLKLKGKNWIEIWSKPDKCDIHNYCGNFSSCNINNWHQPCKCLPGFIPRLPDNQNLGGRFQGCVRKSNPCTSKNDMIFLDLTKIKVRNPDMLLPSYSEKYCQSWCRSMCPDYQCQAYSYNTTTYSDRSSFECGIWTRDLPTLQEEQDGGIDLSILVKSSDIGPTDKSCELCGTYMTPYPLSTSSKCGDPMYNKITCNSTTGQVNFMMHGEKYYRVTFIDGVARKFYIQTSDLDHCSSSFSQQNYTPDYPFTVTNWCFKDDEIELSWQPPHEPICTEDPDCKIWPHSKCNQTSEGAKRCLCNANYQWNGTSLSCVEEPSRSYSTHKLRWILIAILAGTIILTCTIIVFAYVWRKKVAHKLDRANIQIQESLYDSEREVRGLIGLVSLEDRDSEGVEVPYYPLGSILAATENFSDSNKLGRGGYGPVYKGRFPGGQDIAVKRLSSVSTQGFLEFKNEVVLIAKLQHRNLVRLRGYCINGDEKILLYEYMPNKSLDSFIFDRTRTLLLDWKIRFDIILGIARGLLYLHQDSRLRVIHRDLKTSNILLDEEMTPKISDFGLAKIFGGKETEASTERVVGTYGYMAPEYALDGLFSIKSDVFSFGVVLLEILSGKRNTGFYQSKQISSLLGYAWRLFTENKLLDLMDISLHETCDENQFIKCATIGLLCVQDEPSDRPTVSNVVTMLDSEIATIPIPMQPTFFAVKRQCSTTSSSSKPETSMQFDTSYQEGR